MLLTDMLVNSSWVRELGTRTVHFDFLLPFRSIDEVLCCKVPRCNNLPTHQHIPPPLTLTITHHNIKGLGTTLDHSPSTPEHPQLINQSLPNPTITDIN